MINIQFDSKFSQTNIKKNMTGNSCYSPLPNKKKTEPKK